jgi:hypothetical protein
MSVTAHTTDPQIDGFFDLLPEDRPTHLFLVILYELGDWISAGDETFVLPSEVE